MPDALTPQALPPLQLPIVFTPDAWQHAVMLEHSEPSENLLLDRLSNVLRAVFETRQAHPHESYVVFEVVQAASVAHPHHTPFVQLSLSLCHELGQPDALLIALAGDHPR
ncbi:hypothetical protein J2W43_004668 [Pseudomonas brassicacearum]|uniref:Uncharacterized protein n=1 Tax=Pseudomonas brassicacearum TaxID=930166 RepID=A0AAW8MG72_9PSED|nr:hypothetical protein [Pseudomonas brassicacearum]MDR6960663.1 hypothetical protein [Pseudomonas brassicacearum]